MSTDTDSPDLLKGLSDDQLCRLAILTMYGKIFPGKPPDREKLVLYSVLLEPMTAQILNASMQKLALTQNLWPSIAEISSAAESLRQTQENNRTPTYEEAWSEVMHEMSTCYPHPPHFSTPTIHRVVQDMGWSALCELTPGDMLKARAQFRDLYNQAVDRERDERQNQAILDSVEKTSSLLLKGGFGYSTDEPRQIEEQSR